MSAIVLPYPQNHRRSFITRHARRMTELSCQAAENHLAAQLKIQRDTMMRKGIAPELVRQECQSLENAIRAELWRLVLTPERPGGAA